MRSDTKLIRPQALRAAYQQLIAGAETLLAGHLFWTDRALLSLVSHLYRRRLAKLASLIAEEDMQASEGAVRKALLESMAEAALGGHDLDVWESVDNGYQARCLGCGLTSWVGHDGLSYSLLEDECPDETE